MQAVTRAHDEWLGQARSGNEIAQRNCTSLLICKRLSGAAVDVQCERLGGVDVLLLARALIYKRRNGMINGVAVTVGTQDGIG
jgi:hypothetical protein